MRTRKQLNSSDKSITKFDLSTLYTTITHSKLGGKDNSYFV